MKNIKKHKQLVILIMIFSIISCQKKSTQKLDIWEKVLSSVKSNDKEFLIKISNDTLDCIECNEGKSIIIKEKFFSNSYDQLQQLDKKEYSYYVENSKIDGYSKLYRINYNKENNGNKYNIIYSLLEGEKGIKFLGVFSVP
jgi:predicted metalloprotease with PDZ domain|tara:strand:+ start:1395 stop:1817 length:423 start_codon:yes stop_codon:yes gene_type:complete